LRILGLIPATFHSSAGIPSLYESAASDSASAGHRHFALETALAETGKIMLNFLDRTVVKMTRWVA
jgi:hypothetical protein